MLLCSMSLSNFRKTVVLHHPWSSIIYQHLVQGKVQFFNDSGLQSQRYYSRYVQGLVPQKVRKSPPWRLMFFGTDEYALTHLKLLNENRVAGDIKLVERLEVVVPHFKCPVSNYASQAGLRIHTWPLPGLPEKYDVGMVISFGHLIPKWLIDIFPYGILNIHPSILPRWRGASPILHTILNGDVETGISIMEIRPIHFDIGPLLLQSKFAVPDNCTAFQLRDYLAQEGSIMMMQALKDLPTLEKMEYEQSDYGVTYAHKLSPSHARVNWEVQTPTDIDRQYRALSETFGLRSHWKNQPVRLLDMVPPMEMIADDIIESLNETFPEQLMTVRPGIPYYNSQREILCINCKDGWVGFRGITLRKPMSAKSFYNGYLSKSSHHAVPFDCLTNELEKCIFKLEPMKTARVRMNGFVTDWKSRLRNPDLAILNVQR